MRIIYSVHNLSMLFRVDKKVIKLWTTLGLIPCIEGCTPIGYDKAEIDIWITAGGLAKIQTPHNRRKKGRYGVAR